MYRKIVVFGGCGYIGKYFTRELLKEGLAEKVYLVDIKSYEKGDLSGFFTDVEMSFIEGVYGDVREKINLKVESEVDLIVNMSAVHREPGHETWEFFETNVKGAENIVAWADFVSCKNILFTSTIATYGPTEDGKFEGSLQAPVTAYGSSKLAAEKIQYGWYFKDKKTRKLIIVRPGVVFGPGETGNVTRLVRAVLRYVFVYIGNQGTKKASIYIKELCASMLWVLDADSKKNGSLTVYNAVMEPTPTISGFVEEICHAAGVKRWIPMLPYFSLYGASIVIEAVANLLGVKQPVNPVRIKKLVKSNNIYPKYLIDNDYPFKYDLKSAMSDWKSHDKQTWSL